jgi:hypothetical protein
MRSIKVLCVPGPSANPERSGLTYFLTSFRMLASRNDSFRYRVYLAGIPEHELSDVVDEVPNADITVLTFEPRSIGLTSANGSEQHSTLLNALLRETADVPSDYTLILDPDFFVVAEGILERLASFLDDQHLSLIGAPFPEWRIFEYWDFPTVFFLFGDSASGFWSHLDFRPGWSYASEFRERAARYRIQLDYRVQKATDSLVDGWRRRSLSMRPPDYRGLAYWVAHPQFLKVSKRTFCGDTGHRIRERYHDELRHEEFDVAVFADPRPDQMPGFRVDWYLAANPDVQQEPEFGLWHAANVGIMTGRPVGHQPASWRAVSLLARVRGRFAGGQPTTHLVLNPDVPRPPRGDLYLWQGAPIAVHLSSRGKRGLGQDIDTVAEYARTVDAWAGAGSSRT